MAFKVVGMGLVLSGLVNLTTGLILPVAQAPELVQLGQGAVVYCATHSGDVVTSAEPVRSCHE